MNINSPLLVPKPQLKRDRATPYLNFSPKFWYSVCQANYRELPLNALILLGLITSGISVAWADWTSIAQGTGFYTDDVGIFSATRRLTRDGDPTPIWSIPFDPKNEAPALARDLTVRAGDRLRLAVAGNAAGPRWAARVSWKLTNGAKN